jgi:hypothetical protein
MESSACLDFWGVPAVKDAPDRENSREKSRGGRKISGKSGVGAGNRRFFLYVSHILVDEVSAGAAGPRP